MTARTGNRESGGSAITLGDLRDSISRSASDDYVSTCSAEEFKEAERR